MSDFHYRTEDIQTDEILTFFVPTKEDRQSIDMIKSGNPVILEGSRGTGKSFLMKVAEIELTNEFEKQRILPVYLTFVKSSLIHTSDQNQFQHWMLARLCSQIIRALRKKGLLLPARAALSLLRADKDYHKEIPMIEMIATAYEESWKDPGKSIDTIGLPDVSEFKSAIEDICEEIGLKRICILFDEAVHIFRPEQQRQFFTLFRDLRSPYLNCNAAVYPGVTSYGPIFQPAHDATFRRVERDLLNPDYLSNMREIVIKQADSSLIASIDRNINNFNVLACAVSGNPRYLLKTVARCPKLSTRDINEVIKKFYRDEIWTEHSGLADMYPGHKKLIDWGRDFIEKFVLPETKKKNDTRSDEGRSESTCYFWIHRDSPEIVKEALRLLAYTGIIEKVDAAIRGTRSELGTRYALNFGCLLALEAKPNAVGLDIAKNLSIKRFTEFGANHPVFQSLQSELTNLVEPNMLEILKKQLSQSIDHLDITAYQNSELKKIEIKTVADILKVPEKYLIEKISYVGTVRARRIINAATASVLEYLSG